MTVQMGVVGDVMGDVGAVQAFDPVTKPLKPELLSLDNAAFHGISDDQRC